MPRRSWMIALVAVPICAGGELVEVWSGSGKIGHKRFAFTVTAAEIAKTPVWHGGNEQPPLSRLRAEAIARKQLQKYAKETIGEWHLRDITLRDMGDHKHWIYHAAFDRSFPNKASGNEPDQFNVPVLMDGRVVAPQVFAID